MQFVLILAVLAALTISDSGPRGPVSAAAARLAVVGVAVALVAVFALAASKLIARRLRADFGRHELLLRRFRRLRNLHRGLWLATTAGIFGGLQWGRLVRFNWSLDRTFLVDEVLILAPVLLPLVLSWAAFYDVDRAVCVGVAGRLPPRGHFSSRGRYVAFQTRLHLGMLLLPVLGLLAVRDAFEALQPGLLQDGYQLAVFLPTMAALCLFFPLLLRHVWQTRPLPAGPLRSRLEEAARRWGFGARDILVWDTGGMVVNAAVAGFMRPLRYVFLSDALLQRLEDEEIEMVFGHDVGHVRHRHLPLRVLTVVAPLSLWLLLQDVFPTATGQLQAWVETDTPGLGVPLAVAGLGALAVYLLLVFGSFSRLLEHQADLFGCTAKGSQARRSRVETFTSALEKLAAGSGAGPRHGGWQHASIARRIELLNLLSHDTKRELHFRRRIRLLSGLLVGVVVSPVLYRLLLG